MIFICTPTLHEKTLIFLNRTLEDVDRFFATKPGILIHRNKVAVQLQRPVEYIEADERIARGELDDEKSSDNFEMKETV
jgi:hypothetical protein